MLRHTIEQRYSVCAASTFDIEKNGDNIIFRILSTILSSVVPLRENMCAGFHVSGIFTTYMKGFCNGRSKRLISFRS